MKQLAIITAFLAIPVPILLALGQAEAEPIALPAQQALAHRR